MGMERLSLGTGLEAAVLGDHLTLSGELRRTHGAVLEQWLQTLPPIAVLDLAEFDIGDGVAATHALNAIRLLCSRVPMLCIEAAPQLLAHNLYRTGLLSVPGIVLKDMREDEPYG